MSAQPEAALLAQSYDPFGNVVAQAGLTESIFGHTGEQMDPTGLVFLPGDACDPRLFPLNANTPEPGASYNHSQRGNPVFDFALALC